MMHHGKNCIDIKNIKDANQRVQYDQPLWCLWPDEYYMSNIMRKPVFKFPTRTDINLAVQKRKIARGKGSKGIVLSTYPKQRS